MSANPIASVSRALRAGPLGRKLCECSLISDPVVAQGHPFPSKARGRHARSVILDRQQSANLIGESDVNRGCSGIPRVCDKLGQSNLGRVRNASKCPAEKILLEKAPLSDICLCHCLPQDANLTWPS